MATQIWINIGSGNGLLSDGTKPDIKYTTTSTGVGYGSGFELTKDTPYLALAGELWDVFCEYFDEKRSCYKGVLLYLSQW